MFQTEDHDSMMSWIAAIQTNNNPDEDVSVFFVTNGTRTDHIFSFCMTIQSGWLPKPPCSPIRSSCIRISFSLLRLLTSVAKNDVSFRRKLYWIFLQ